MVDERHFADNVQGPGQRLEHSKSALHCKAGSTAIAALEAAVAVSVMAEGKFSQHKQASFV